MMEVFKSIGLGIGAVIAILAAIWGVYGLFWLLSQLAGVPASEVGLIFFVFVAVWGFGACIKLAWREYGDVEKKS